MKLAPLAGGGVSLLLATVMVGGGAFGERGGGASVVLPRPFRACKGPYFVT